MEKKKINALREYINKTKAEKYPIENEYLKAAEDHVKNLYLKMLAVIIQQGDNADKAQTMLFDRLVAGTGADNDSQHYYKKALEVSTEDFNHFVEEFGEKSVKYRFLLDALLLMAIVEYNENQTELIAGIMECFSISKQDAEFISTLAVCILEMDNKKDFSKYTLPSGFEFDCIANYIDIFPSYCIVFSNTQLIFLNGNYYDIFENETSKIIHIKNCEFKNKNLKFKYCNELHLDKCTFENSPLEFYNIVKTYINDCTLRNITDRAMYFNSQCPHIHINGCSFINCEYNYTRASDDWRILGGVIYLGNNDCNISIHSCEFKNCGGRNNTYYHSSATICNAENINVSDCKFINCWNYNMNTILDPKDSKRTLFVQGTKNNNNEIINSANFS